MASNRLTHFDSTGNAHMVDVGSKPESPRSAQASAKISMKPSTLAQIIDQSISKGDVLGIARIAGINGAKQCSTLIPLCHPVRLTAVTVDFEIDQPQSSIEICATVHAIDRTGPEMEALVAASTAALTIYDMCKSVDRGMQIDAVFLLKKSGGKSGEWNRDLD